MGEAKTFEQIRKAETAAKCFAIVKSNDDKRLVFGWANVATRVTGEVIEDFQDDIIEIEVLEKAAYEYVLHFGTAGEMHERGGVGRLVESVVFTKEKAAAMNVYAALQTNPSILERIKYQGSEANPADVTANVLAQLFKVDEFVVAEAVVNRGKIGAEDKMEFVCDPNSLLLCYTTSAPAIDEPSAGYTFAWDMLGNGQYMAVQKAFSRNA
ncbi:MAG: XkdF-like putative serine protease domain-containing protein [Defluviitaleaceae bacterium]|nr:XkdF-like putative serine protease domain-containing protein [Defluviitaleaceae bacterium]MCL2262321.1 XkdF-like putative serine protease domain-containing protein [Defluviitaleaceae bacterium]